MIKFKKHLKQVLQQLFPKKHDQTTSIKHMTFDIRARMLIGFKKQRFQGFRKKAKQLAKPKLIRSLPNTLGVTS